jgi:hypothetical protein
VALVVAGGVDDNVKAGTASYWLLIMLALSWLTLAFISFGGAAWLQTGTWPALSWSF